MATPKLKIVFAGTPEFAAIALAQLIKHEHEIVAVYTQPDRPAGRGRKLAPSPVKQIALDHHIPVEQPASLKKDPAAIDKLKHYAPDVMIVAAYGLLLPQSVLDIPTYGCRAGVVLRRSSARSSPAIKRPASPSCRWTLAWIPVICCWCGLC